MEVSSIGTIVAPTLTLRGVQQRILGARVGRQERRELIINRRRRPLLFARSPILGVSSAVGRGGRGEKKQCGVG
jgi:hypothetical protein